MFQSSVLDRTRMISNILLIILLAGNIFFSVQYIESIKQSAAQDTGTPEYIKTKTAAFLRLFIDKVLHSQGTITFDDRVKLENDIRQLKDPQLTAEWENFVNSTDAAAAQENAVQLMLKLSDKLIR